MKNNYLKNISKSKLALAALLVVFFIVSLSQLERLSSQGTFFGYKLRQVSTESIKENRGKSGRIKNPKGLSDGSNSEACKALTKDEASAVFGLEFSVSSGFVEDKKEPNLISSCIYTSKDKDGKDVLVSFLMRDQESKESAQKTFKAISDSSSVEQVSSLGDGAQFNKSSNQLTVIKDNKILTLTLSTESAGIDTLESLKGLAIKAL